MSTTGFLRGIGLTLLSVLAYTQDSQEIRGRVLDASGKPAVGARVHLQWQFAEPRTDTDRFEPTPSAVDDLHALAVVDDQGHFSYPRLGTKYLFAVSADGASGALASVGTAEAAAIELRLSPLVKVRCRFEIKTPGEQPKQTAVWVSPGVGTPAMVAVSISNSRTFEVGLPAGTYSLWYSTDSVNLYAMSGLRDEPLVITEDQNDIDLGSFTLEVPMVVHPSGLVIDSERRPVRASLATQWRTLNGRMSPFNGFNSDETGRFRGNVEIYDSTKALALLALDGERKQAAIATWTPGDKTELEIQLEPAVRVTGSYRTTGGAVPGWSMTYMTVAGESNGKPTTHRIAQSQSAGGRFELSLPPGRYQLEGYGAETQRVTIDLELRAEEPERDLGVIELPQTVIALNKGKPAPPLHVTDARGLDKDFELADLRGKWVLIEFWGYW